MICMYGNELCVYILSCVYVHACVVIVGCVCVYGFFLQFIFPYFLFSLCYCPLVQNDLPSQQQQQQKRQETVNYELKKFVYKI